MLSEVAGQDRASLPVFASADSDHNSRSPEQQRDKYHLGYPCPGGRQVVYATILDGILAPGGGLGVRDAAELLPEG